MSGRCQGIKILRWREKAFVLYIQQDTIKNSQISIMYQHLVTLNNYLELQLLQSIFEMMALSIEVQRMT
jgi:hypothetical protein